MKGVVGVLTFFLAVLGCVQAVSPATVRVIILSEIDDDLGIYWVNSWKGGELVRQKEEPIAGFGQLNVDSFNTHSFLIIDEKYSSNYKRYDRKIWDPRIMTMFTMGEFDLEVKVSRGADGYLRATEESALTRTAALMEKASITCRKSPRVQKASQERMTTAKDEGQCLSGTSGDIDDMAPEFKECLTQAIATDLAKKEADANKNMRMLEAVGDRTRNYTCIDPEMETSNATLPRKEWKDPVDGRTYHAKVFLDEPSAKIMLLDDFASDEECAALKASATPHLQDATVNAGAGKSQLSSARRAKAGAVGADLNNPKSKTASLYRRGYGFANHITGYNLPLEGQEGFSVIKYGSTDEYRPHCDGDCTGAPYKPGGRVSTMVIYCERAEVGGGTTFSSSDVFINGDKGQAVFFSYLGPDGRTDTGRTRHSGCPIVKGTKWIATLWMRIGVSLERGWENYDPSGMPSAMALNAKKRNSAKGAVKETADGNKKNEAGDRGIIGEITGTISSMFSGGAES